MVSLPTPRAGGKDGTAPTFDLGHVADPLRRRGADPADWAAALAAHNAPNPQSSDDGLTLVIADPADAAAESAGAA